MKQKRGLAVFLFIGLMIFIGLVSISCTVRLAEAQVIPKEAKIHNQLGNDYCDKGDFEKGVVEYEKAVKVYPRYTDALYNAGLTYYLDLKDYAKAVSYFRQFIQVEGESADAKQVKKWLAEAGKKLAAQKNAQPKGQQVQVAQGKDIPPEDEVKKEPVQKKIPPSAQSAGIPQEAGQAAQPPQATAQALPSHQQAAQEATPPPPQQAAQAEEPPITEEERPVVAAMVPSSQGAPAEEPKKPQVSPPSREEQARVYKNQGNDYNNRGKHEEAVKEYAKALQIYPEYTDVLYNIAKTYDFNLKDYPNAIRYYKQFLQYESPTSRDAAQVKIWLGRAEESLQALNKPVQEPPKAGLTVAQKTNTSSVPAAIANISDAKPDAKVPAGGKKMGDFFIKEFLSPPPVKGVTMNIRGEAGNTRSAANTEEKGKSTDVQPAAQVAKAQSPAQQEVVAVSPVAGGSVPPVQERAASPVPVVSSTPVQTKTESSGSREILIETIFPKDMRAADMIPVVMSRMQQEIAEVFAQAKVQSPEKLAELYLSKIQSDILPSGERVSSFRLGGKELADLPYIVVLSAEEKTELEKEKWDLIRTRKSPARLKEVLTLLRDGYKVVPR